MAIYSALPPSSASRRLVCPGSRLLEAQNPSSESEFATEGAIAHSLAALILKGKEATAEFSAVVNKAKAAPTQEMAEAVTLYTDYVKKEIGEIAAKNQHFVSKRKKWFAIEEKITISTINENCVGTPDAWVYDHVEERLHVFDFKFGFKPVEAFENWQLVEYAAGILGELNLLGGMNVSVTLHIIQPRAPHVDGKIRTWCTTVKKLHPRFEILRESEAAAMRKDAPLQPGAGCYNCSARHVCNALQNAALTVVDVALLSSPLELNPNELGNELRILTHASKLLEARKKGLEAQAESGLKSGKRVPFFTLEKSYTNENWTVPDEEVIEIGKMFNRDFSKPIKAITPAQARALLKGDEKPAADYLKTIATKYQSGFKLKPEDQNSFRKTIDESVNAD